ncbi:MAG TPA: amidase [Pseudomonadales bacterium]|nr:amidase [Pseudomonadales bacterium]
MNAHARLPSVLLLVVLVACAEPATMTAPPTTPPPADEPAPAVSGRDIPALQAALASGELDAAAVVAAVADDVEARDAAYRAVLRMNSAAMAAALALDASAATGARRGALHGIPVMLKDNLETEDMPTTAGALALAGNETGRDAPLVARLRAAGAVIVAKTNLSEWANFRSERSSSGWSGMGGQTRNAVAPTRSPCGSSSGSAVAVALGYVPLAVGTETNGSIVCPAAVNGIVGFKPTVGAIPGAGIVPIAHTQDTAGPMARTVHDAAVGFAVMADLPVDGTLVDVDGGDLAGMRIGVVRSAMGYHEGVDALFEAALARMEAAGAVLVDDLQLKTHDGFGDDSYEVLLHEFRNDLAAWFDGLPNRPVVDSLEAVVAWNREHMDSSMPYFRQEILEKSLARGPLTDAAYVDALARIRRTTRDEGLDRLLAEHALDAVIAPTEGPAWSIDLVNGDNFLGGFSTFAAVAGYPHVTLPMGTLHGLPIGLSFVGGAGDDVAILALARGFERLDARPAMGVALDGN